MLGRLLGLIDNINRWVAKACSYLLLPMLFVSIYEVIARYIFDSPTTWAGKIISILFVALVVPGGGYVLMKDGHVRMDVFYSRWSPKRKAITEVATFIIFLSFASMLSWKAIDMAWSSLSMLEKSWGAFRGPIYPKKMAFALGAVLVLLQGLPLLIRNIILIRNPKTQLDDI